jgi:hypothetical protein
MTEEPKPGAPYERGWWKMLLVFAVGIAGGLVYLDRHRVTSAPEADMPTPDVVTLTAPRSKPVEPRPMVEVVPSASAPSDAGAPQDASKRR